MARPRKAIPDTVGINMVELASKLLRMNDSEAGAWLRKAVSDCVNGCKDPDCDPFIRVQYERTVEEMQKVQDHNAEMYRRRTEKKNLAESATRTSEAVKAMADAPTREDGEFKSDSGDAGNLESATSAKTLSEAREAQARESLPAGERGKRSRAISRPVDAPAGSPVDVEATPAKRPYGSCGHVMLTNEEGAYLREIYGEYLEVAIDILDGYLENNPKALKKYKNHSAVLRKGNWVYNKILEMKDKELRLNNAKKQGDRRSFAQKDRDDRSNWLTHSMFELPEAANG